LASAVSALAYGWLQIKLSELFQLASDSNLQPSLRAETAAKPAYVMAQSIFPGWHKVPENQ